MTGQVLNLTELLGDTRDALAVAISNKYTSWEQFRQIWAGQKQELRNYLFATDTLTTTNKKLPWKNSTTVPKLTQIRDNLHANYMSALFPNDEWLQWEGDRDVDETEKKRSAIESYMRTKARQDKWDVQISRLILDYIDYGNCFGTGEWADDSIENPRLPSIQRGYVGPRPVRISPFDLVFNPVAPSFEKSPKIIRSVFTLGDIAKMAKNATPNSDEAILLRRALDNTLMIRKAVSSLSQGDTLKDDGYTMDGFGNMRLYYETDYVEVLTFYGDIYDTRTNTLYENHVISVMDRNYLISKKPNPSWLSHPGIFHAGWRERPDNLYAQGPLDNLVGMQYRIDHLENLKADVFDIIGYPVLKIKGFVEDFDYEPGARIYCGDDGDVEFMHPDVTVLNADTQIMELERRMEEMAGAPKEAMGIRTPGEKTKFEVQTLDNAASRIFMNKISHFEKVFFEPLLNYLLQLARQNMSANDVTRTLDSDIDAIIFSTVTKEDIIANGILRPSGARHFAEKANTLQTLIGILNSPIGQDPAVNVHLSGKKMAKLVEELADLERYKLFGDNVRVIEMAETQALMHNTQEQTAVAGATPPGLTPGDAAASQVVPGPS